MLERKKIPSASGSGHLISCFLKNHWYEIHTKMFPTLFQKKAKGQIVNVGARKNNIPAVTKAFLAT